MGSGRSWSLLGHFDPTTGGANQEETIRERHECVKSKPTRNGGGKTACRMSSCYQFMVTKLTLSLKPLQPAKRPVFTVAGRCMFEKRKAGHNARPPLIADSR